MALKQVKDSNHFVINFSEINTSKLFVEFYLPEFEEVMARLSKGHYPLHSLHDIASRMFDGPFGSDRKVDMYQTSGIPYVRVKQVQHEGLSTEDLVYISPEKHQAIIRSRVVPGNVLLTIAGSLIGKAAVFPETFEEGNISGHLAGIEIKEGINPHYLAIFINSKLGKVQITRLSHRSTRRELNLGEVRQILVPIPPRSLQDLITQIMKNAYDDRREKMEQAESSFLQIEDYVLKVLQIPFCPPSHKARFIANCSGLHRWEVRYFLPFYAQLEEAISKGKYSTKTLKSLCEKITNGLTPAKSGYTDTGCIVIKVASLTKLWQIDWKKVAFTTSGFFEKAKKAHIRDGDLLILSASHQLDYIGRSFALVRDIPDAYSNQCMSVGELIIIRPNQEIVLPEYLLACLTVKPVQDLVNRMTRGQSAHLYAEDLQHLQIPVPPLSVQQEIVTEMDKYRMEARRLRADAEAIVAEAKARVERMILGEE